MKRIRSLSALALSCLLAACTLTANAQTGASAAPGQATGHGLMGHMRHAGHTGRMPAMSGRIIGNKRSHVYHLPGDKGSLPGEQNRVYFRTEAEARAAGYRIAGKSPIGHKMRGHALPSHKMGHTTH